MFVPAPNTSDLEQERLAALRSFGVLDTPPSEALDALVAQACRHFGVPVSTVTLVDENRQWFKAVRGLDTVETDRAISFCDHTIRRSGIFVVENAAKDSRFSSNPLVTGEPGIRFYAGVPLTVRPGIALGSLCIIDTEPRTLTSEDREFLRQMGTVAMAILDGYRLSSDGRKLAVDAESHRRRADDQSRDLKLRERQFMQTEQMARVGGWEMSLSSTFITWSDEIYRIHEVPEGTAVTFDIAVSVYPPAERRRLENLIDRAIAEGIGFDDEFRIVTPSGATKWVRVVGEAEVVDGSAKRLFGILQDISNRHAAEAELWNAANHDALTGLANRARFSARLAGVFARRSETPNTGIGLLMIDVDHLKVVNDTLGHEMGDLLLRTVAERISAALGEGVIVARIGGDEFAALPRRALTKGHLEAMATAVLTAMLEPIRVGENVILPQVSIGGAVSAEDDTAEILRQKADLALSEGKSVARSSYTVFRDDMRSSVLKRFTTLRNVEDALHDRRMLPYYQPIVKLDTAEIVGLEALARMRQPDGRIVAAGAFHEALREPRIAHRLTTQMLGAVARDLHGWLADGYPFQHVGINVTTADFQAGDLRERILRAFGGLGVPLKHIAIEVTETVFLSGNEAAVVRAIEDLREDGILIALDDFGTGFASLTHLRSLPVDVIKIDKSFVDGMMQEETSGAIVDALVSLASRLGLKIVAEGIESVAQAERLKTMGCKLGQGYLYARPAAADVTGTLLRNFGQHRGRLMPANASPLLAG